MATNKFSKQPYEEFTINADFSANMAAGEVITEQTAWASDKDGDDATNDVLDANTLGNDGGQTVQVLVKGGDAEHSPYKLTIRCVTDAENVHKWEMDIFMFVREI